MADGDYGPKTKAMVVAFQRWGGVAADGIVGVQTWSVSGDLNVVHTTGLAARLLGFRGAFLQGLGTANHVLSDIASHMPGRLDAFAVTFARPLYVGQTVELARDRTTFEVTDQRKHLVAYGTYRVAT